MSHCSVKAFTYYQIKNILKYEYRINLQKVTTYMGKNPVKPNKYILLYEDYTLAFKDEVTLDELREFLTTEGYDLDYE